MSVIDGIGEWMMSSGWSWRAPVLLVARVTLILGAALAVAWMARAAAARVRYVVLSVAFVGALLLPLSAVVIPPWSVPIVRSNQLEWTHFLGFERTPPLPATAAQPGTTADQTAIAKQPGRDAAGAGAAPGHAAGPAAPGAVEVGEAATGRSAAGPIVALWLCGSFAALISIGVGCWRTRRIARRSTPVGDGEWHDALANAKDELSLKRRVRLLMTGALQTPMTGGSLWPFVFLPQSARQWQADRRRVVLLHELVHVQRHDWIMQFVAQLVRAIHWYNPLVWIAYRRFIAAREQAVDERILNLGIKPSVYARHLLEIADAVTSRFGAPLAGLAMAHTHHLEGRLMSILKHDHSRRRGMLLAAPAGIAMAAAVITVATVYPWADELNPRVAQGQARTTGSGGFMSQGTGSNGAPVIDRVGWEGAVRVVEHQDESGLLVSMREHGDVTLGERGQVVAMSPEAMVTIETSFNGAHELVQITTDDYGALQYNWSVNGRNRPFGADGQRWLDAVTAAMADLRQVGQIRGEVGALKGQIGQIRGHVGQLQGQIGRYKGHIGHLQGQIGQIQGEAGSLKGKIGAIHGEAEARRGAITRAQAELEALEAHQRALDQKGQIDAAELQRIAERRAALEQHQMKLEEELSRLDAEAHERALHDRIAELNADERIAEIRAQLDDGSVQQKIGELENQIASFDAQQRIAALEEQIAGINADERLSGIEERLQAQYRQLERLIAHIGVRDR